MSSVQIMHHYVGSITHFVWSLCTQYPNVTGPNSQISYHYDSIFLYIICPEDSKADELVLVPF